MAGTPPPPDVELSPITILVNGKAVEISLEDMAKYHADRMGKQPQICGSIAATFRASSLAISELWPEEAPERSDIMVKTHLLTPSSVQAFQFLLGIKNSTNPGILHVLLLDGSEVTNLSAKNLKKLSMNSTPSSFNFTFTRISTNESMTLNVREEAFPSDFFELRKKVKFGVPENATQKETDAFKTEWADQRDFFMTAQDYEMFEGVEPADESAGMPVIAIVVVLIFFGLIVTAPLLTRRK